MDSTNTAAMATTNNSKLLDLLVELLQMISGPDHSTLETIIQIRQTCKTLESATFDRFADSNFGHVICCIFRKANWTRLHRVLCSPRLGGRVREVTFTSTVLGTDRLQLAPGKRFRNMDDAKYSASFAARGKASRKWPSTSFMIGVLRTLSTRQLFQVLQVTFEIAEYHGVDLQFFPMHRDLMLAAVSSSLRLSSLVASRGSTNEMLFIFDRHGQDFLNCILNLQTFRWITDDGLMQASDDSQDFITNVLEAAKQLCTLKLDLYEFEEYYRVPELARITQKFLNANDLSNLSRLRLNRATVEEKVLIETLARTESRLVKLHLDRVKQLTQVSEGWRAVVRLLSGNPDLSSLKLGCLQVEADDRAVVSFTRYKVGKKRAYSDSSNGVTYKTTEEVAAGLRELAASPLEWIDGSHV